MTNRQRMRTGGRASGRLRPGVAYPDRRAIASARAGAALDAIVAATGEVEGWCAAGAQADRVRSAILEGYRARGLAPSRARLARACGLAPDALEAALDELARRDMIVRDPASGEVVGAYPLSDRARGVRLRIAGRALEAMCAIDALGVAAMYGVDGEIVAACAQCGAPIEIETARRGRAIRRARPADARVWAGIRYDGQAARSLCGAIVFLCSSADLGAWRAAQPGASGFALSLDEALEVGRALFGPLLAPAGGP